MTLYSDFRSQVRRALEEPTANVWSDESLLYWTNEATRDLSSRVRQNIDETYITTVADLADYTLDTDTQELLAVYYDGRQLERAAATDFLTLDGGSGTPLVYQRMDEAIRLRPAPDGEKTLLVLRKSHLTPLEADDDEMPFRGERNTLIEYFVLSRAFEQTQDWESATQYRNRYENALTVFDADEIITDAANVSSFPVETY